jgi:hypothetical protein
LRKDVRELIRKLSRENALWGAPRIPGELLKLGIDIGETSVGKYLVRHRKPPSQTWRTFLENHVKTMVSVDFFTVPTITFQVLYVFLVLAHDRRRIVHFNVTAHPTAEWTRQPCLCGTRHRHDPERMPRSRDRLQPSLFVPAHEIFPGVLSRVPDAPGPGQGRAGTEARATAGTRSSCRDTASWRASSPVRAARRLNSVFASTQIRPCEQFHPAPLMPAQPRDGVCGL